MNTLTCGLATSNLVLVQLQNDVGMPLSTHAVRQMLTEPEDEPVPGRCLHAFRHIVGNSFDRG